MQLSIEEKRYLVERRQELQREIRDLRRVGHGPCYHDVDERRVELLDELNRVEAELKVSPIE